MPVDYNAIFPELNGYLIRPLLVNPPMCKLIDLQNGTYTLYDIELMHQMLDLSEHINSSDDSITPYGVR